MLVHAIFAIFRQLLCVEQALYPLWILRQRTQRTHQPAISQLPLLHLGTNPRTWSLPIFLYNNIKIRPRRLAVMACHWGLDFGCKLAFHSGGGSQVLKQTKKLQSVEGKLQEELVTSGIHRPIQKFVHEAFRIGHLVEVNGLFLSCVGKAVDGTISKSHESLARELTRWRSRNQGRYE